MGRFVWFGVPFNSHKFKPQGTFGRVTKIRRISDGANLVWKEMYYGASRRPRHHFVCSLDCYENPGNMNDKEKQQLVSEVNILRELDHRNIVRYYDRIIDRDRKKIFIVMEFCSGGDLSSLIKRKQKEQGHFPEAFIWKVFSDVAQALAHCHCRGIEAVSPSSAASTGDCVVVGPVLHRDLKPSNILLSTAVASCNDLNFSAKLADFGLARALSRDERYAQTSVGTPYCLRIPSYIFLSQKLIASSLSPLQTCLLSKSANSSTTIEATSGLLDVSSMS